MVLRRIAAELVAFGSIRLCRCGCWRVQFQRPPVGDDPLVVRQAGAGGRAVGGSQGTVLFGFLLGQADWVAECISPCPHETSCPTARTEHSVPTRSDRTSGGANLIRESAL